MQIRSNTLKFILCAATSLVPVGAMSVPAAAQQIRLEEIVVTARKRDESLMEVPLAITAFSAATLEKMNLTDMTDLATFTPGFQKEWDLQRTK